MENDSYLSSGDTIMTLTIRKLCAFDGFAHRIVALDAYLGIGGLLRLFNFFYPHPVHCAAEFFLQQKQTQTF